ncbi:MAG: phosphate transport system regulatory protein PhoU [Candidatus Electrothrix sp. AW1]|nr:phosphate transport system regulatory protein PhoU [Candidatus Electrothrix sp. AX1]MCI5183591.1 phosphate transport system regulatory protein PhoU [Candidatus Electrothrix gigas]
MKRKTNDSCTTCLYGRILENKVPDKKVLNRTLHREIDLLKKMFIDLGSLVEDRLRKACIAIESGDKELAEDIIRTDNAIDQMEVQIEEECLKVLALHQPVASDLRLIVAIIKINNELERIGDMAVGIARRVQVIQQEAASFAVDYTAMAVKVLGMIKMSLDALLTENADLARKIFLEDQEVDVLRNEAYQTVVKELNADTAGHAAALLNMYLLARHLERIGDRACNIAEEVIYLVEGDIVRNEEK